MSQIYTNLLYCIAYAPHFGLFASHLAIYRPANGPQDQAMVPRQHGTEEPVHGVAAADCCPGLGRGRYSETPPARTTTFVTAWGFLLC